MRNWESMAHVKWECKLGHQRNFTGLHFWARGYCVSTIGLNEEDIRRYVREQEDADQKQSRLEF